LLDPVWVTELGLPKDPKTWTTDQVCKWALTVPDVEEADAQLIKKQRITGASLLAMTKIDLERCGIPIGPATNLIKAIESLKPLEPQAQAPAQGIHRFFPSIFGLAVRLVVFLTTLS
jgi:hypothetical protein